MAPRVRTSESFRLSGWVGDIAQLERIVKILEELAAAAYSAGAVTVETQGKADFFDQVSRLGIGSTEKLESRWLERVEEKKAALKADLEPYLTVVQRRFRRSTSDRASGVLDVLDVEDDPVIAATLRVGGDSHYAATKYEIVIRFDEGDGVAVTIESPDPDWTATASRKLEEVLKPRRPRYVFLRQPWVGWVIVFLPFWVSTGVSSLRPGFWTDFSERVGTAFSEQGVVIVLVLLGFTTVALGAMYGINAILRRFLPAFELLKRGAESSGKRAIGLIGAAVLYVGGIVIPLILR